LVRHYENADERIVPLATSEIANLIGRKVIRQEQGV